jgi:hypothetical protein
MGEGVPGTAGDGVRQACRDERPVIAITRCWGGTAPWNIPTQSPTTTLSPVATTSPCRSRTNPVTPGASNRAGGHMISAISPGIPSAVTMPKLSLPPRRPEQLLLGREPVGRGGVDDLLPAGARRDPRDPGRRVSRDRAHPAGGDEHGPACRNRGAVAGRQDSYGPAMLAGEANGVADVAGPCRADDHGGPALCVAHSWT